MRNRFVRRMARKAGFTLMELLLVLLIIGILAAMVVPRLVGRSKQAKIEVARADIEANISIALGLYELDNGTYPTTDQGLKALITKPDIEPIPANWRGPYVKSPRIPKDPWGNVYKYVFPGLNSPIGYDLSSFGPDKIEGSEDDIANWDENAE